MVFTRKSTLPRSPPSLDTHWQDARRYELDAARRGRGSKLAFLVFEQEIEAGHRSVAAGDVLLKFNFFGVV
jgi:hypothetical protein